MFHARVVNQIARGKVVGTIQDHAAIPDQALDIRVINVGYLWLGSNLGIDFGDVIGSRDCFGQTLRGVAFGEHRLPLKI